MGPVNVHAAKTHFSSLLARVARGESIVIARAGKPVARLVPYEDPGRRRVSGQDSGKVWIAADFDGPLPDEILDAFEGKGTD